jgi:hypothetical protein
MRDQQDERKYSINFGDKLQQPAKNNFTLFSRKLVTFRLITLSRAFEKLGKANIRFVMSVRLPDRLLE